MRKLALISAIILVVFISGCTNYGTNQTTPTQPPAGGNRVAIQNFAFSPSTLTVKTGTTVTWTNEDSAPHRIEGSRIQMSVSEFQSENLINGQSYNFTFNSVGTYDYFCSIHPSMKGKIVVE